MADEIISKDKHNQLVNDERFVSFEIAGIEIVKCEYCKQTESSAGRKTCRHCGSSLEHSYVLVGALGEKAYFVKKSEMSNVNP